MRVISAVFAFVAGFAIARADEHIILPPRVTNPSLPEKMLVFMPGGAVPNEYYRETAIAIQEATHEMRLWVTIPHVTNNLCIIECSAPNLLCYPLHRTVEKALSLATDQGWQRGKDEEDLWLAGHSLGGICSNTLVQYLGKSAQSFAGLMVMGSYVDKDGDFSVANYPIPILTLNVELDFGGGRPGKTAIWWKQHLEYEKSVGYARALKEKPVFILPGLNHSDFCPGFDVPGDLMADVDQVYATAVIGTAVASFLHSQSGNPDALSELGKLKNQTRLFMDPYLRAEAMELSPREGSDGVSSFCEWATHFQAGLSEEDDERLHVTDTFFSSNGNLEHCHPAYETVRPDLQATSCSHTDYYSDFMNTGSFGCSKQISCKMLSSDRLAEQLNTTAIRTDVTCRDINMKTVQMIEDLAPKSTIERFKRRSGRGWCFEDDTTTFGNIGPLWLLGNLKLTEKEDCMSVSSLYLHTETTSKIFPGSTYCKLLSPTRILDWMMTDSIKPFESSTVLI